MIAILAPTAGSGASGRAMAMCRSAVSVACAASVMAASMMSGVALAEDKRPVGEGQRRRIMLVDDLQGAFGWRQRMGDRLDEARRRRALARDDTRQQFIPALLAAAIDAIARADVAVDVGGSRLALGGARNRNG